MTTKFTRESLIDLLAEWRGKAKEKIQNWNNKKIIKKCCEISFTDIESLTGVNQTLATDILTILDSGGDVGITKKKAPSKKKAPAKKKKAPAKKKKAPAKKKTTSATGRSYAPPSEPRKTGVQATIREIVGKATAKKPVTHEQILNQLAKKFKEREKESMRSTVLAQVPTRCNRDYAVGVKRNDKGYYVDPAFAKELAKKKA